MLRRVRAGEAAEAMAYAYDDVQSFIYEFAGAGAITTAKRNNDWAGVPMPL
jgi:hypothetical protein